MYKSLGNILSTASREHFGIQESREHLGVQESREHFGVQESREQFGVQELFASHKIMFEMGFITRRTVYIFFSFDLANTDRCAVFQLTVPTP